MKIYIVQGSEGSYDDYHEYILKSFISLEKAKAFEEEYNKKLEKDKAQAKKCENCSDMSLDEDGILNDFQTTMKCFIQSEDDEDFCKSDYRGRYWEEVDEARIVELEVEE